MAAKDEKTEPTSQIPTNLRVLRLVEEVARTGGAVSPAKVGEALGLPKATIHRLFQTAADEGYVQRDISGRAFVVGPKLRELSTQVLAFDHSRAARVAILKRVTEEVGETCNLAVPDADGMVYLDRVETSWPLRIQLPVGSTVPFHCTASGKMLLSSLPQKHLNTLLMNLALERHGPNTLTDPDQLATALETVRAQGYSTDDQEFLDGMAAVAVPIQDISGRLLATLSVHAPLQRKSLSQLEGALPALRAGAEQLRAFALGQAD